MRSLSVSCWQASRTPPVIVTPLFTLVIEPAAISEVQNVAAVRAPALLTTPFRALEADGGRELRPIDWIEPARLGTDWHQVFTNGASAR